MKPERQIADIYHDILAPNDGSDAATVRVIRDLDHLYTGTPIPAAPGFSALLAARTRSASLPGVSDRAETTISGSVGGRIPPRSRSGWLRQGFAFAGAAVAFALVATILVLLFRESDEASTPGTQPDASPTATMDAAIPFATNSDQIAFTSVQDGNPEIYLINADGSGLTRLTDDPAADSEPAWSPDGSQITFTSDRDGELRLYVMNADGTDARLVTDEASGVAVPVWSPDGEWIAFVAFTEESFLDIFIVHPDGTDLRQLTDWQGIDTTPAWSPTSEQIVFTSDSEGADSVFVVNIDGTDRASLSNSTTAGREPDWSPDGARIVFSNPSQPVIVDGVNYGMLETIAFYDTASSGGAALRTTSITGRTPRWSPDGRYVVYRNPDFEPNVPATSSETLHIVQADGLETGRMPGIDGAALDYDWAPNGEALAVAVSDIDANGEQTDARGLWLAQLDGSAPVLLAEQLDTWARPAWRPDPSRTPDTR